MLNIGQAADATGVSAKMIRHYEELGLLPAAKRNAAGYRQYDDADIQTLRFIRHARDLGFPLPRVGRLLSLWTDRARTSREVKALAQAHIIELDDKASELLAMKAALERLVDSCHGNARPECPIIDTLASSAGATVPPGRRRSADPPALRQKG